MPVSLKTEILQKLQPKKSARKATTKITENRRPKAAIAKAQSVGLKVGDKPMYEGKQVLVQSLNESSGMAVIKLPKMRDPKIVRMRDLKPQQNLNEGVIGLAAISPTYRDPGPSQFMRGDLSPEDIGLDIVGLREVNDDDDEMDNGGNVRNHGHDGKREVDEIPTPSDTIATAYSDEIPPKEMGSPLSVEPGHTVATDPDFHGYDFPADSPDIPTAEFDVDDNGNSRAPHWNNSTHDSGVNIEKRASNPGNTAKFDVVDEGFSFIYEMGDMLGGGEDHEPQGGDTITVTLPAMASIVCTVASKMGGDQNMMKAMIEALAEVGGGKTIDMPDLGAVASHMNGEECEEIDNREAGNPDHQGIDTGGDHKHDDHKHNDAPSWPGDGEKTNSGKTKLMGGIGVAECGDDEMAESVYYSWEDMVAEHRPLTYEEELREMKRRAGLKFW